MTPPFSADRPFRVVPLHLLSCLVLGAGACSAPSSVGESIVFGVAAPFQEGYGNSTRLGAELAREQINEGGGIDGRPLELRLGDDGAHPGRAIEVANAFLADPRVVAVAGHVNSGTMSTAGPVYDRGLPAVATSATSPIISRLGRPGYSASHRVTPPMRWNWRRGQGR